MNICADNYSKNLGAFSLVNINLEINEGEIFAILGETGSGKSILLESLAGFYQPDAGIVTYNGADARSIPLEKRNIGFVYQDYGLFPHMNVRANIEFGLKMRRLPVAERRGRAESMMKRLRIEHIAERKPGTLSGGEQQRAALARALVLQPEVLFMDEPFSALDPNTKRDMYALIKDIHHEFGCTIVFVTHDFNEAAEIADRVGIVIKGELRSICAADSLNSDHDDPDVAAFLNF